ncbi:MAG: NAD(P)H-hydrate dehydratase [Pirellulaceae bacterium]
MSSPKIPHLPPRDSHGHKGSYGRALIVGGSPGMVGSVAMSGIACMRGGAGLVTVGTAGSLLDAVSRFEPSCMTLGLPEDRGGRVSLRANKRLQEWAEKTQCLAIGPGLGTTPGLRLLVAGLYRQLKTPLVIDADGLNALANSPEDLRHPGGPRVLTPHLGEFRRLTGNDKVSMDEARAIAPDAAKKFGCVLVLKGARTLVTDGQKNFVNETGNPGMGTGGTGDVLTGLITALVCQGMKPFEAASLGVYLHGLAGDLAAERLSQEGMIASDLIESIPEAWKVYRDTGR